MAIFEDGDKVQKWLYRVKSIHVLVSGNPIVEIPAERLRSFSILDDYENHIFPIFKIELALESSIYYLIIKNKDTVKFHLRIQKYFHYSDQSENSLMRDYINDNFDLILDDSDEDMKALMKREAAANDYKNVKEDDTNDLHMVDNVVEFFLFKTDIIKATKKNINHVLVDSNVTDAIGLIFTQAGISNVLMSPPNNHNTYPELFIPPLTCGEAIQFLDTYYGLYKKGSVLYYGLDYTYLLADTGKCTAWIKSEVTTTEIIVPAETSKHTTETGNLQKQKTTNMNYVIADYKTIAIRNDSISEDVLNANDVKYVDNYDGSMDSADSNATTKTNNSRKVYENKTENKYLSSIYTSQTASNSIVISLSVNEYDVAVIQPNKRFLLVFEDTSLAMKYKGEYQIVSVNHNFIKEGSDFAVRSIITLKKT